MGCHRDHFASLHGQGLTIAVVMQFAAGVSGFARVLCAWQCSVFGWGHTKRWQELTTLHMIRVVIS